MPESPRSDWLSDLITVVRQLCHSTTGRTRAASASEPVPSPGARKVGRVTADPESGAGWFWIGLKGRHYDSDELDDAFLAPPDGSEHRKYQLIETIQDGNVLRIRAAEHAPQDGLCLWVAMGEPGRLEKSLLDGLSSINRFDLINRFAEGRTDPITGAAGDPSARARAACTEPGVHLVWGPPGTGKTRVIAHALADLIGRGKSVLLVSGTNIAVDNAVERAFSALGTDPGTVIRVGKPALPSVSSNSAVCLDALIRERQGALERQRLDVQEQIGSLSQAPAITELADVLADLHGFDPDKLAAAQQRLQLAREITVGQDELNRLRERSVSVSAEADARIRERDGLVSAHESASEARGHIDAAEREQRNIDLLEGTLRAAESDVVRLEQYRTLLLSNPGAAGVTSRFGRGSAKALLKGNERELTEQRKRRDELHARYEPLIASGKAAVESHLRNALPYTRDSLDLLDSNLTMAQAQASQATDTANAHAQRVGELQAWLSQAAQQPQATEEDQELVATASAQDLPGKLARLPGLRQQAEAVQGEIAKLEKKHEQLLAAMRREKSDFSREIIRKAKVVATTLARARMNREVWTRDYDFVIVDEVASACPPEVLCAASRAREGITLLGDFMQNSPIVPAMFDKPTNRPAIRQWYQQNCFALFGIHDARSAQANPGCVTLTTQYRFGPVINDLANAVAYDGLLEVGNTGADHEQDVVLIDVDGLGSELAAVRSNPESGGRGWWPIGALIAQALAEQRTEEWGQATGLTAGILTPYKTQQEIIQDFLTESDANPQIEVGTSHRFQGREFDTVIFDMVEDGKSWIARGDLRGTRWAANGVRLFNVGITRARRHLYLIANGSAVRRARTGPLRAVAKMVDTGAIRTIGAAEILGLPEAPAGDPVASEVWHALRDHATLIDLYDEDRLPEALSSRIDRAETSIWLWSPWVGKRSRQFMPHLRDAADRGVVVRPVILPHGRDVGRNMRPFHDEVAAQFPTTIRMHSQHQKIIVIDRSLTFIGSMNVLSHQERPRRGRLEIMALFKSGSFAQRVLDHERADQLANPPASCPQCGAPVNLVRKLRDGGASGRNVRDRDDDRLHWVCDNSHDGETCGWKRPFPDIEGTRNQRRPRR